MGGLRIGVIGLKGLPAAGGAARAGEAVIRRLADRHRFVVFSMASHAGDPSPYPGVEQVLLPAGFSHRFDLAYYYAASAWASRGQGLDLVHFHHGMSGFFTPLVARRLPTVVTLHGYSPAIARDPRLGQWAGRLLDVGERLCLRHAHALVTVARAHAEYYAGRTDRPLYWIPNGVEPVASHLRADAESDGRIIFAAARIIPGKGAHLVLEAVRAAGIHRPVVIAGALVDSGYATELRRLARGLDVEFTGLITERKRLLALISGAGVFVFPSYSEAMSNMLLEAVMVDAPLVCSDIPENRAVLRDEECLFFRSGSAADLAAGIRRGLADRGALIGRVRAARRRLTAEQSWDTIADRYAEIYERVAATRDHNLGTR